MEVATVSNRIPITDPYPDKTPRQLLSREYKLGTINLSTGDTEYMFPFTQMYEHPTIVRYLQNFRLFRSGLRLVFRPLAAPMQYGMLGISYLPYTSSTTKWMDLQQQVQSDMIILDITEQEGCTVELPYLRPALYHTRTDLMSWRVVIHCFFCNAITEGAPTEVPVDIFGSLLEPEAAQYLPTDEGLFQSSSMHSTAARVVALGTSGLTAIGVAHGYYKAAEGVVKEGGEVLNTVNAAADAVHSFVSNGTATSATKESKGSEVKLDLMGDISAPDSKPLFGTRLGDNILPRHQYLPDAKNVYNFLDICKTPALVTDQVFTVSTDVMTITCTPFNVGSRATYIARMFRYFRGGSKILLKFCAPQMVSARFKVVLFTGGEVTNDDSAIGDVLSWIVTVKGSMSWGIGVPYMQKRAWYNIVDDDEGSYQNPILKVQMLDNPPQPFDKAVSIYVAAFGCVGDDFQMAGLQSCVPNYTPPPPEEEGTFQSIADDLNSISMLGGSSNFPYQGRNFSTYEVMSRLSSRKPLGDFFDPFPYPIVSWVDLNNYDNYDWLANMYAFYTGDVKVKMLFSKAPADGTLKVDIVNSRSTVNGSEFKAGNSMAVAHQSVWPVIEFVWPYMNKDPFNSIWENSPMFSPNYDGEAKMSEFLVSATEMFQLFFLMPVPDFFLTEEPSISSFLELRKQKMKYAKEGFQSHSVPFTDVGGASVGGAFTTPSIHDIQSIFCPSLLTPKVIDLDVSFTLLLWGGADMTQSFKVWISDAPYAGSVPIGLSGQYDQAYAGAIVTYGATAGFVTSRFKGTVANKAANGLYINVVSIDAGVGNSFTYIANIQMNGFHSIVAAGTPNDTSLVVRTAYNPDISDGAYLMQEVGVVILESDVTLDVSVVNTPIAVTQSGLFDVAITGQPVDVNVVGVVDTQIVDVVTSGSQTDPLVTTNSIGSAVDVVIRDVNMLDQTSLMEVAVDSTVPVTVAARVQGVVNPDTPVWTSNYFT